jgi:hypothetical protein
MHDQNEHQTEPISPILRIETQAELDRIAEGNQRRRAENERQQARRTARADAARRALAETPYGATALAAVEAIRAGNADPETRALGDAMADAAHTAEALCERFLVDAINSWPLALHLTLPFAAELQKLAKDARYALMAAHMVDSQGQRPTGVTINDDGHNLLTSVICYATSRSGVRWVLGDSVSFGDVAETLAADCHCDLNTEPFRKKLQSFKVIGRLDCFEDMAEQVENHSERLAYYESFDPQYRGSLTVPESLVVGQLFPVAFENEIVFLKLCAGHAFALASKYQIEIRGCAIEDSWEGIGNYW